MIYISPDRTSYTNLPEHIISSELETITGADMLISSFPVEVFSQNTLQAHIQSRGLFVQIKIGYDILNFDGLKSSIARMQKCQIPQQQAILLFIGRDWQDDNHLFRVENAKSYGDTTYKTFIKLKAKWRHRYGVIDWINNIDQLPMWIEAQQEALEDIAKEGKREIYPTRPVPQFEPEDIFQNVIEISEDDWRYFLCAGLKGFGAKTASNVQDYIHSQLPHLNGTGYYALKCLTDEDEKNKALHNISGWGDKSRAKLRLLLGLPPGYNLAIDNGENGYLKGWYAFGNTFRDRIKNGESANDVFAKLMAMVDEFGGI